MAMRLGTPPVCVITMIASGTVTVGETVMLAFSESGDDRFSQVKTAVQDVGPHCGVALNTAADGEEVRVQVSGKLLSTALAETDVTASADLVCNTTDGKLGLKVAADLLPTLAIALADDVAGVVDVYLYDPLGLAHF